MKILVTGDAGFIGSHVCNYFTGLGHKVVGIDDFNPFYSKKFKRLNIAELWITMMLPNFKTGS